MNIRVMVVEDEPPILRAIKKMITECDSEFTVCHTAKNGAEAMEYLRGAHVDVLFTDIRMPLMDGLSLMENIHLDYPHIIVVVLSGYQDFEYAKHAIINNVFDYLLKPITVEAMSQMLAKLKTAYYQRSRQEKTAGLMANIHQLGHFGDNGFNGAEKYVGAEAEGRARMYDGAEAEVTNRADNYSDAEVKDKARMFDGAEAGDRARTYDGAEARDRARMYDSVEAGGRARMYDDAERYMVVLICAGPAPLFDDEDISLPGGEFWDKLDPSFLDKDNDWFFMGRTPAEKILIRELADEEKIEDLAARIFAILTGIGAMPLTMVYFGRRISFTDVGTAIRALQRYLPGKLLIGASRLLPLESVSQLAREVLLPLVETDDILRGQSEALINALIPGVTDIIEQRLSECLLELSRKECSYLKVFEFFDQVILKYEKAKLLPRDVRIHLYEAVYQSLSYDSLKQNLMNLIADMQSERRIKQTPELIIRVKEYLEESYRKPISGADISRQFGLVPSYISRIFRQHFGYSPANYITMLRIEEARRLLRGQPDMLIKEVALQVGYKDQHHFSKVFKKETGVWPTVYRG